MPGGLQGFWISRDFTPKRMDDAEPAPLVRGLLKHASGIARLADEAWLSVSAPQS